MKDWKIILEREKQLLKVSIKAKSFQDAYIKIINQYPDTIIKGISEIRNK